MRAALLIAGKDLRQRLRDRSAVMIAVVVPLALAAVFSLTLAGVSGGEITFRYGVVNLDRGQVGAAFVEQALGGLERDGLVEAVPAASVAEGERLADRGKVSATFVVPAGFSGAVESGRAADLQVIGNPDARVGMQVARSIAEAFTAELTAVRVAAGTAAAAQGGGLDPEALASLGRKAAQVASPVAIEDESAARHQLDADTFYAAGMAVFFLFFTVQFGVSSLLDERREGTLARLVAAPIPRAAILGGKLATSFVLGVAATTVLVVGTSLLLGADWGNPFGVGLLVVAGVLAATSVMALVSTLARTAEQAGYWQAIVALVLGLLGGAFFPVSQVGGIISTLSLLTPHAWFLRGLGDLAGGGSAGAALPAVGAILAFAAVTGSVALLRIGRVVQP